MLVDQVIIRHSSFSGGFAPSDKIPGYATVSIKFANSYFLSKIIARIHKSNTMERVNNGHNRIKVAVMYR